MNFNKLEELMSKRGVNTLADIARILKTTPQAVSNWKSRNQIPYHVVAQINKMLSSSNNPNILINETGTAQDSSNLVGLPTYEKTVSFSDILLTIAEQLKVIFLMLFLTLFFSFTYSKFIKIPKYTSSITLLIPENKPSNLGGLAGLASQFGVDVPTSNKIDLSNPSLFPELIQSRRFAENMIKKEFITEKHGKKLPLLILLQDDDKISNKTQSLDTALGKFSKMISYDQNPKSSLSQISVTASEPVFAKELAEEILKELESLNRFFRSQAVNERIVFIENRINSVETDLTKSEKQLNNFNEQNRQTTSPALQLKKDRFERNVEVQKGIYLTLKQQLELAKIEEIQEASIIQVLDGPQVPISPSNSNLRTTIILAIMIGLILGVLMGFVRSYFVNAGMNDRKKLRRVKIFIKKKTKDLVKDQRISGMISLMLIAGLPFYLGWKSQIPVFFGRYSYKAMGVISIYIVILIVFLYSFLSKRKQSN